MNTVSPDDVKIEISKDDELDTNFNENTKFKPTKYNTEHEDKDKDEELAFIDIRTVIEKPKPKKFPEPNKPNKGGKRRTRKVRKNKKTRKQRRRKQHKSRRH